MIMGSWYYIVDGEFAAYALKYIYSFRKDEELRPYDKQISINASKKIGAPLLGLAKYIYYCSLNQ